MIHRGLLVPLARLRGIEQREEGDRAVYRALVQGWDERPEISRRQLALVRAALERSGAGAPRRLQD